jgi:hypothetical protein
VKCGPAFSVRDLLDILKRAEDDLTNSSFDRVSASSLPSANSALSCGSSCGVIK